jgi:hypothetical protein
MTAALDLSPAFPGAPTPKETELPGGQKLAMFTREHLTILYKCSHGELGRLLSRRMAPLPIRVDGTILWHVDECLNSMANVVRTLERWRHR